MVIPRAKNKPGARPPGLAPPFLFACVAREHTFSGEEGHLLWQEVFTRKKPTNSFGLLLPNLPPTILCPCRQPLPSERVQRVVLSVASSVFLALVVLV